MAIVKQLNIVKHEDFKDTVTVRQEDEFTDAIRQAARVMDWDSLDAILTIPEAARFLKVGYRRMLEICHMKCGRDWRINKYALQNWVNRQTI